MDKETEIHSDFSRRTADTNVSEKASAITSVKDAVIRTYAKDLARVSKKTKSATQKSTPAKLKERFGIPLGLVIHKKSKKNGFEKRDNIPQTFNFSENKISADEKISEQTQTNETLFPKDNPRDGELLEKVIEKPPLPKPPVKPIVAPIKKTLPEELSSTEGVPSPIHTYKSDFVDKMHKTGASHVEILAEEQDAGKTVSSQKTLSHMHTLLFSIGGVLLFAASVLGVMYTY